MSGKALEPIAIDHLIKRRMQELHMAGLSLAIVNDGKVVYRKHFGDANAQANTPITDATRFEGASMTKPVFAWLVMRMVDKGLLDLDRPLHEYWPPQFAGSPTYADIAGDERHKQLTARMVLTHQTGFPNWRYGRPLYFMFDPGTAFSYSGEGFVYLGKVLEHLGKAPLEELMQKEVFKPLGMTQSSLVWSPEIAPFKAAGHYNGDVLSDDLFRPRFANPASSLLTHTADLFKFMQAVMNREGLSAEAYAAMLNVAVTPEMGNSHQNDEGTISWGLGWVLEKTPHGLKCQHGGNNGDFESYFELAKDQQWGYVYFSNSDQGDELNEVLKPFLLEGQLPVKAVPQTDLYPFAPESWSVSGLHSIGEYLGRKALFMNGDNEARLTRGRFKNMQIDFDIALPRGYCSAGVRFRKKDDDNHEQFYLRAHESGGQHAMQYTPVFNGMSGWQLYSAVNYQRSAHLRTEDWMHVRLAIFDDWMEVFIDDMDNLALHVFDLKQTIEAGEVALWSDGPCYFSNFCIRELDSWDFFYDYQPKPTPPPGTVTSWQLSETLEDGAIGRTAPTAEFMDGLDWKQANCEYNGLVNLARYHGTTYNASTVIAKFSVDSETAQQKRMQFGFSDIAKIFVNGKIIYDGQCVFGTRDESYYGSIGYYEAVFPELKAGKNEILFVVTEQFGGWGVMAKFDDMAGLKFD